MKDESFLPSPVRLSQAFENDRGSGGVTRRTFIKRSGGATVTSLVAWNLATETARAEDPETPSPSYGMNCTSPADGGETLEPGPFSVPIPQPNGGNSINLEVRLTIDTDAVFDVGITPPYNTKTVYKRLRITGIDSQQNENTYTHLAKFSLECVESTGIITGTVDHTPATFAEATPVYLTVGQTAVALYTTLEYLESDPGLAPFPTGNPGTTTSCRIEGYGMLLWKHSDGAGGFTQGTRRFPLDPGTTYHLDTVFTRVKKN